MHGSSLKRMSWFVQNWLNSLPGRLSVLDVGSCEVAGGSYRTLFPLDRFDYKGLDMTPGPNVDIAPALPYHWTEVASDSFDVVISGQAFEHMEFFWLAAAEMARCLKPNGLLCIIAPRGFERHRYPVDCYRFDADGMIAIARWCNLLPLHASSNLQPEADSPGWHIENCEDSLLIARKPTNWPGPVKPGDYKFIAPDIKKLETGLVNPAPRPQKINESENENRALRKTLIDMADQFAEERKAYERTLAEMDKELQIMRKAVAEYEGSNSWKLTRPLRYLGKMARQLGKFK